MTIDQWLNRASGWTVIVPKGTDISKYHGTVQTVEVDTSVTIEIDPGEIRMLIRKALRNTSRRSRDGALTVKVVRR